jgi:GDP-L-fucose synthase
MTNYFSGKKIWITGHRGMLGSSLVRLLCNEDAEIITSSRDELNLLDQNKVLEWMKKNKPDMVVHAAAKVGGILANKMQPANFLYENLLIETSVIHASHVIGVEKLIFVASNCAYPVDAEQPIKEHSLLSGRLEDNIRFYAISKIAGIELCRAYSHQYGDNFISVIPPNLYGPGDNYHPEHCHVIAGILSRAHESKLNQKNDFVVWGDGSPRRECLYIDDLASAIIKLLGIQSQHDLYNIGFGQDFSIADIAKHITDAIEYKVNILYDTSKPNGSMSKLLDSSRILETGWKPTVSFESGLKSSYSDFLMRHY